MVSTWHQQDKRETKTPRILNALEKRCSCCKQTLKTSDFWRDRTRIDGLDPYCHVCRAMKQKPARRPPTAEQYQAIRRKQCLERVAYWTNELNKTGCGPDKEG